MTAGVMRLRVHVPGAQLIDRDVIKLEAEGPDGFFILLPHHIDMVAALKPGLLRYVTPDEGEHFLGVDEGVLVKCGFELRVALRRAVESDDLEHLRDAVAQQFLELDDHEQSARSALARLETGAIRALMEIER